VGGGERVHELINEDVANRADIVSTVVKIVRSPGFEIVEKPHADLKIVAADLYVGIEHGQVAHLVAADPGVQSENGDERDIQRVAAVPLAEGERAAMDGVGRPVIVPIFPRHCAEVINPICLHQTPDKLDQQLSGRDEEVD
jgi:hypothetical protein